MPLRRSPLLLFAVLAATLVCPAVVDADNGYAGGPDENRDRATPGAAPADTRPSAALETATADSEMTIFAAAAVRNPIDDFLYDELVLEGTAREVCAGRLPTGSGWTFNEIVRRFGGSAGTMYYCRERWDAANDPACNGQQANPVTSPNFRSTCWSNHAQGRAIDVMVGRLGSGYNRARGEAIINWLLARDTQGHLNSNARKLGIQQILFADRCWNSEGDRGISSWRTMRPCGIGHHDHVHLDLTINGANGNVSYWGRPPRFEPKLDTQVFWDFNAGWRQAVSWWNLVAHDEEGLGIPGEYEQVVVGDLDSDDIQDEIFLYDGNTGNWIVQNWTNGDALNATVGRFSYVYDQIRMFDIDSDGRVDDMFLWDRDTGNYVIVSWSNYGWFSRRTGYLNPTIDTVYPADLDGNGRVNDVLLWDRDTGKLGAARWIGNRIHTHYGVVRTGGWDELVVGDWSAGGDLDDMLIWNRDTGRWQLFSWASFRPTYRRSGAWSPKIDLAAPGDYDTDGRIDDLFIYDRDSGNWAIHSFHRYLPSQRTASSWGRGYDIIPVGSFMD